MKSLTILFAICVINILSPFSTFAAEQRSDKIAINTANLKATFVATILNPKECNSQCREAIKGSSQVQNHIAACATTNCQAINITENISACTNCRIQFQKI